MTEEQTEAQKLYDAWIKNRIEKNKDPLTRTESDFAKFCFMHHKVLGQIGGLDKIFKECREHIKRF